MFYDSRNGYQLAGSTTATDFEVSLRILKWSFVLIVILVCVASLNGCQGL